MKTAKQECREVIECVYRARYRMCYDFIRCSHSSFFFFTFSYGLTVVTFLSIYTLPHAQHPSYSCAAMHSLFTLAQPLCTVCLLLRSHYAQPYCTVYKDWMDTLILQLVFNRRFFPLLSCHPQTFYKTIQVNQTCILQKAQLNLELDEPLTFDC